MGVFIAHENLPALKEYKYQSDDRLVVTKYVLKPFWLEFVKLFPMLMAPNAVTLSGFMFIVVNVLTVLYYNPYLDEEMPRWTYFLYAFGLFMYQTFDACDGTHARRTGQSGPLGELFDHCVDAMNTLLCVVVFGLVIRTGYTPMLFVLLFATLCNFYLSTWEEYHTHVLFLLEVSGPVEGILMLVTIYILTGVFGPDIWSALVLLVPVEVLPFAVPFVTGSTWNISVMDIAVVFGAAGIYFNIHSAHYNVSQAYKGEPAKTRKALRGLVPLFLYAALCTVLMVLHPLVMTSHAMALLFSIGFTMAFTVGRIIIGHLLKQKFPMRNPPMFIPLCQMVLILLLHNVYHYDYATVVAAVVWGGLGLTMGIHGMFITEIIYEITLYLDIYALSIKHPKVE